jgi:hypothetical protein
MKNRTKGTEVFLFYILPQFKSHIFKIKSQEKVTVIAHENLPPHFHRYVYTNGYNGHINQRQFRLPHPYFPKDFRFPDITFEEHMTLKVGRHVCICLFGMLKEMKLYRDVGINREE